MIVENYATNYNRKLVYTRELPPEKIYLYAKNSTNNIANKYRRYQLAGL